MPAIADLITETAQREGVDPDLALEVALQESNLNPHAVSSAGAIGVMQLMPATAAALGVDPTDVAQNIEGGIRYLAEQLQAFGHDAAMALAAYNWGPAAVAQAVSSYGATWLDHAPAETQHYVAAILSRLPAGFQPSGAAAWKGVALFAGIGLGIWYLAEQFS